MRARGVLGVMVASGLALAACSDGDSTTDATGGSAGAATGGSGGTATGGSGGSATGGSGGTASGGTAGSATGGAAGSASGGTAGSSAGGAAGSSTGGVAGTASGGSAGAQPDAGPGDGGKLDGGTVCTQAGDCKLFSSYCSTAPCECMALQPGEADPICKGTTVNCTKDPCQGKKAQCNVGVCSVQ